MALSNNIFRIRHNQFRDTCGRAATTPHSSTAKAAHFPTTRTAWDTALAVSIWSRRLLMTTTFFSAAAASIRRRRKDPTAPDLSKCQDCLQHGSSCQPFRPRKTAVQEQKERDENGGVDPNCPVVQELINNADNVLFRCIGCFRAFHFEHLLSLSDMMDLDMDADAEQRFREYSREWKCKECVDQPAKVSRLIAWKPTDEDAYDAEAGFEGLNEQDKNYLVNWEGMCYFRARWMPSPWAFAKREDAQHPKMRTEDAIPEDYLCTDIVLDTKYTSIVDIHMEEVDKARIREVDKALIKYKGLTYEDAVWTAPPSPDDGDRWSKFVVACNDWVAGRHKLEKKEQPPNREGGKLMEYQVQGLNWLYYKWFTQKNAILADEMGLGKTIQIIGFLATLVQDHSCFPFLIVVPNSTCPNWRREIKR